MNLRCSGRAQNPNTRLELHVPVSMIARIASSVNGARKAAVDYAEKSRRIKKCLKISNINGHFYYFIHVIWIVKFFSGH